MTSPIKRLGLLAVLTLSVLASAAIAGRPARFVSIDYPGAIRSYAYGINAVGDIVGAYVDKAGDQHGFVLGGETFSSIDYPGTQTLPTEVALRRWTGIGEDIARRGVKKLVIITTAMKKIFARTTVVCTRRCLRICPVRAK